MALLQVLTCTPLWLSSSSLLQAPCSSQAVLDTAQSRLPISPAGETRAARKLPSRAMCVLGAGKRGTSAWLLGILVFWGHKEWFLRGH